MSLVTEIGAQHILADAEEFAERLAARAEAMDRSGKFDKEILDEGAALGFVKLIFNDDLELDLSRMPLVHEVTERIASVCPR